MSRDNKSKYAIMGLNMEPMSGYSINNCRVGFYNFWSESYGQIYPILRSLVAEGLATTTTEVQTGKPNRHVYALTDAGRADLMQWLARPVDYDPGRIEDSAEALFRAGDACTESLRQVEEHRKTQEALLDKYSSIEEWLIANYEVIPGCPTG